MKTVQMLDVGDGVKREIEFITAPAMGSGKLMIELYDERQLSQIAADFEDRERLVRTDNIRADIETVYTGFTKLTAIQSNEVSGSVRITLAKP